MKDQEQKITISISGAAEISHCGPSVIHRALEVGRACARAGVQLATGATSGFPNYAAQGYKEIEKVGNFSFGLSPASTKREHEEVYVLPLDHMDAIIYTGFGFPGRDLMLVRSSDAVIIGCGRIGTIHEFTVAWESEMPIGILEGEWSTDEVIKNIIDNSNRVNPLVVFDSDPERLVQRLIDLVKAHRKQAENTFMSTHLKAKA